MKNITFNENSFSKLPLSLHDVAESVVRAPLQMSQHLTYLGSGRLWAELCQFHCHLLHTNIWPRESFPPLTSFFKSVFIFCQRDMYMYQCLRVPEGRSADEFGRGGGTDVPPLGTSVQPDPPRLS